MIQRIDTSGDDLSVAKWIWRNLVPKDGQASTVQGELLRAVEKLRWEAQENGNINWDDGFVILIGYLRETLNADAGIADSERQILNRDLDRVARFTPLEDGDEDLDPEMLPYVDDDLYDRLTSRVVAFSRANPEPIMRSINPGLVR
jgi:hypothetical protein